MARQMGLRFAAGEDLPKHGVCEIKPRVGSELPSQSGRPHT